MPDEIQALAHNNLLIAINDYLHKHNKSNSSYNLPMPDATLMSVNVVEDSKEFDPNAKSCYNNHIDTLDEEQHEIFDSVSKDIKNNRGSLHCVDIPGGSGKTHLANLILALVQKEGQIALATALSGITATILTLGKTFH